MQQKLRIAVIVKSHLIPLMLRRLSAGLLVTAAFVAPLAATAQEGSAEDLGVMSISLADVVNPPLGFKAHCRVPEHQTKQVLVVSSHCLLERTASSSLMHWLMPTSLTAVITQALLIQLSLVPQSAPQQGLVIAG